MKVLVIYNPYAGNRKFVDSLDELIAAFQKKQLQLVFYRMDQDSSLESFFMQFQKEKESYCKILVAGGDGTLHQVINCMLKYEIDLPLGIYPVGTCNDYARQFTGGKPFRQLTETYLQDHVIESDVGLCNDTYFINVASLGFLIDVSQKTGNSIKSLLGPMAYYLRGLEELGRMETSFVQIESAECQFAGEIFFMLILNGQSAGGFSKIGIQSSIEDGLLDVLAFKKCSLVELPVIFFDILNGRHFYNKNILSFKTKEVHVFCEKMIATDLDGEKGPKLPFHVKVLPQKIKVLAPSFYHNEEQFLAEEEIEEEM